MSPTSSFDEYVNAVAPVVPPSLVSPSAFATMAAVARRLPASLATNTFGFECRMGEEQPQVDFLVQATAASGRDVLAGTSPAGPLSTMLLREPGWRDVQDLGVAWSDSRSVLHSGVDNVWLEFDLDTPLVADTPRPSVFLGLALYGGDATRDHRADARVAGYLATVEAMAELLSKKNLPALVKAKLADCLGALSQHEYVFQVGLMLGRGAEAVRICLRLGSTERTVEYLLRVGWPGSVPDLREVVELTRLVDYTWLDLDVGQTVAPRIGLECYFERHRQPRSEPRWAAFLDALVRVGLCTDGKRDGLLSYPGQTDENTPDMPWPPALRRASQLLDGRSVSTFVRTLHHVKIVCRPGEPLEAKAYLAVNHYWRASFRPLPTRSAS